MTPADIIARLQAHDTDHAAHKAAVQAWLIEAGFSPDLTPCRVALAIDSIGVWCGNAQQSGTRAIDLHMVTDGRTVARLVSYGGHRTYWSCAGASPVEALRALAQSAKVPAAFLGAP